MSRSASRVCKIQFSDLYLGHPSVGTRLTDVPGAPANPLIAGDELHEDLARLQEACQKTRAECQSDEFPIFYDGVTYRVAVMPSLKGRVFVLRRIVDDVRSLEQIGVHEVYRSKLLERDLCGLFLISGSMSSGKTTTAAAMIHDRLCKYGGVAVTAEDPIELPLEGAHGDGVCFQTLAARRSGGFAEAARRIVRWGAKLILIGEIRDGEAAAEALRAAVNGHLVVSTIHAESAIGTISRIRALATESFDSASANALLADGLAGVMHQRLQGDPRRLAATLLAVRGEVSVMSNIRSGNYERLGSDLALQEANNAHALRRPR